MTKEKESLIIAADKADDDSKPEFVKKFLGGRVAEALCGRRACSRLIVSKALSPPANLNEVPDFLDRLRQPDYLPGLSGINDASRLRETHGFASLPHGKFAFIVCNRD